MNVRACALCVAPPSRLVAIDDQIAFVYVYVGCRQRSFVPGPPDPTVSEGRGRGEHSTGELLCCCYRPVSSACIVSSWSLEPRLDNYKPL